MLQRMLQQTQHVATRTSSAAGTGHCTAFDATPLSACYIAAMQKPMCRMTGTEGTQHLGLLLHLVVELLHVPACRGRQRTAAAWLPLRCTMHA
jgi:hypothetical protein